MFIYPTGQLGGGPFWWRLSSCGFCYDSDRRKIMCFHYLQPPNESFLVRNNEIACCVVALKESRVVAERFGIVLGHLHKNPSEYLSEQRGKEEKARCHV